jgi:hypothetical protein
VKRLLVVAVVGIALVLAACLPPKPAATPPTTTTTTTTPPPPPGVAKGFDTCAAPSTTNMNAWKSSPYTSVGIYIGGANRGCAQPNLTSSWVTSVTGNGWKVIPIWVGPQAPCTTLGSTTKISSDASQAGADGAAQATAAANAADALGFTWLAPIYFDLEAYPRGGTCSTAVQNFVNGWVIGLNARGYRAGLYSSLCSGILDAAATTSNPAWTPLNAIWIAAWNNTPNIFGFGSPCALSDLLWNNHQRLHQYQGGHNEAYSGVTMNVDSNAVDGPVFP